VNQGSVDAGYFNPGKINIAEANASLWKGLVKLFIKLQDKGYPGSTYTPYDIAATIATCLEIKPPSGSVGIPLVEVLKGK